jgi:hypothetical protein
MKRDASHAAGIRPSPGATGFRPLAAKADCATIRALLCGLSPPGIVLVLSQIFI